MAGKDAMFTEMYAITNFDLMVSAMETAVPARPPGVEVRYQALSFGWLVGGLVQKVSGEKFGDLLRNVLKEIGANDLAYVGIPKGVEERLATLFWDSKENLQLLRPADADTIIPNETEEKKSGIRNLSDIVTPTLFNDLKIRKSVIPAASGNMSAKGMAIFMDYVLSTQTGKGWSPQTNDWLTSGDGGKQGLFDARISDEFVNQTTTLRSNLVLPSMLEFLLMGQLVYFLDIPVSEDHRHFRPSGRYNCSSHCEQTQHEALCRSRCGSESAWAGFKPSSGCDHESKFAPMGDQPANEVATITMLCCKKRQSSETIDFLGVYFWIIDVLWLAFDV
ncbi:hypothetical protein BCR33DRAFT_785386 [Rhizoclosmatium globosum]|uniref:Beta-lactamase-related domain-containing protein n=1 Tax=Rhizoclosmatium globosum TaxID=329046 RepID=A0A1Y2CAU7_9FUNG|nr:hypothetical protein BCR33DRAFT_785386 [Rhizoclosmatium globosum]|eukprot:ORY44160.1 hypothetical protein BCR33DRAFT_785386 [Rhizoclosmatium globosum]